MGKRKSTRYPGVQARESTERRWRGRPDVCYTIDYRDATGKRVRKDIGWASEGFSAALAAEMRSQAIHDAKVCAVTGEPPAAAKKRAELTFAQAWKRYRQDWLVAKGKGTHADDARIRGLLKPFGALRLSEITAYRIDQFLGSLRRQGYAAATIRHAYSLLSRVIRRMVKWGLYSGPLPFDAIDLPPLNNVRERFLTPDEAHRLLDALYARSPKTWLMALISLHCGMRFGEVARLRWSDINMDTMTIYIPQAKNGRARHAVMTQELAEALAVWPRDKRDDLLFGWRGEPVKRPSETFFRVIDALGLNDTGETIRRADGTVERVKIKDTRKRVVFHTLRHTYASWLALGGQTQLVIADRLGHRSLTMTQRYTHLMDDSRLASAEAISKAFRAGHKNPQS
ncbi:site-specific integrase [uncultured Desulfovibrio sp.]|uniref:tyrosine-type recombinase/integrase n=1 Tax=uncultured Desulfovibrio sp. TaxID=167968 RepID=UPI002711D6F2|nr:site-specific integrase [uncultured Desulfovibrio sp.]